MRRLVLLALLVVLAGCNSTQAIGRAALDERYQVTQLAEGVRWAIPIRLEPGQQPPVVVNWFYAGTREGQHHLIHRELRWDSQLNPIASEQRYRIAAGQLSIAESFPYTADAARWLPLYEAAPSDIPPPRDLLTARQRPAPIETDPVQLPDAPAPTPLPAAE